MEVKPVENRYPYGVASKANRAASKSLDVRRTGAYGESLMANMNRFYGRLSHGNTSITNQTFLNVMFAFKDSNTALSSINDVLLGRNLQSESKSSPRIPAAVAAVPSGLLSDNLSFPHDSVLPSAMLVEEHNQLQENSDDGEDYQREYLLKPYLDSTTAKSAEIEHIYDELLSQCNNAVKSVETRYNRYFKEIESDIREQKLRFGFTNQRLLEAFSNASPEEAMCSFVLNSQLSDMFSSILQVLKDAPGHFGIIFHNFKV
jgi:hypothetical protein